MEYIHDPQTWLYEVTGEQTNNSPHIPQTWLETTPPFFNELEQHSIWVDQIDPQIGLRRAAGLIANWDVCYMNFKDACFTAPPIKPNEKYVYQGNIETLEGNKMPVSILAATKGHHYSDQHIDNVLANQGFLDDNFRPLQQLSYGRYINTPQGIAFVGAAFPHVNDNMVDRINASAISGHWQKDIASGEMEFLGAVFVNRGALPIKDKKHVELRKIAASLRYNHIVATEQITQKQECGCDKIVAATDPNIQNATGEPEEERPVTNIEELEKVITELLSRVSVLEDAVMGLLKDSKNIEEQA